VLIFAAVTVFNWVFNNTNGSVLIMLMHADLCRLSELLQNRKTLAPSATGEQRADPNGVKQE
jgi:hypothetical protein